MSIWASVHTIGFDDGRPPNGVVRAYAKGWSNHYPTAGVETPASIDLARIPTWCVPGHENAVDDDDFPLGPWLRMCVNCPSARTWWVKDGKGQPTSEPEYASVVMDETAARALRDALTEWLDAPKAQPIRRTPGE